MPAETSGTSSTSLMALKGIMSSALAANAVERVNIDAVEALADAEEEDADDDEGDKYRKGDADLDHERHALCARRSKHKPVLERHEADDLAHGIPARHHHQQPEKHNRECEGEVFAGEGIRAGRNPQHDDHREGDERHSRQHRKAGADDSFDL